MQEAFLRAALAEFAALDRAILLDAKSFRRTDPPFTRSSKHPAVHLLREMRNMEVHLVPSRLTREKREFLYAFNDDPEPIKSTINIIDDFTVERFRKLDNARYYTENELKEMVGWFDRQQRTWGVEQVFLWIAEEFVGDVIEFFEHELGVQNEHAR